MPHHLSSSDSSFEHGRLATEVDWIKRSLSKTESELNEVRKCVESLPAKISEATAPLKNSLQTLNESISKLKAVDPLENERRLAAVDRKQFVLAVAIVVMMALLGWKLTGLPWLVL